MTQPPPVKIKGDESNKMWQVRLVVELRGGGDLVIVSVIHHYTNRILDKREIIYMDIRHHLIRATSTRYLDIVIVHYDKEEGHGPASAHGVVYDVVRAEYQVGTKSARDKTEACGDIGTVYPAPFGAVFDGGQRHVKNGSKRVEVKGKIGIRTYRADDGVTAALVDCCLALDAVLLLSEGE